ncbi:MAG: hypothetical protein B7X34_07800 [Acidobacteriia bacterium 12-62-4]|nr:MAG: hypothetical protein B7X34_07800 [Acidobacteriia bacterium 12-62-4]
MPITRRAALAAAAAPFLNLRAQNQADRPNILWILGDDLGPDLGCYGHPLAKTPNVDRFAAEGTRFTHCFTTAPVCSPARSAWNTGVYQTTIGAHNHRSHRKDGYRLPDGVKLISHRMQEAGYFTANVTEIAPGLRASGKTDFNFQTEKPFQGTRHRAVRRHGARQHPPRPARGQRRRGGGGRPRRAGGRVRAEAAARLGYAGGRGA